MQFGTKETTTIVYHEEVHEGDVTLKKNTFTDKYRTDLVTIEAIENAYKQVLTDPAKLDCKLSCVATKRGSKRGYFIIEISYSEIVY